MGCNKPREFLGVKRHKVTIDKSQELDITLCVGGKLRLFTNTPVTVDSVDRMNYQDDEFCIGNGSPYPFLDDTKINIEFDSQPEGVPTIIVGVLYKLVPNPNFKECNCNGSACK